MLRTPEVLDRLVQLAREADAVREVPSPDPRKKLLAHNGDITTLEIEPPLRNHQVADMASLIAWAQHAAAETEDPARVVVWHSPAGVVLVLDDSDRRDVVTFPLTPTRAARAIESLDKERMAWQQRELIRFLRIELSLAPAIVAPWRKLDWDSSAKTLNVIDHGRDWMGRDVAAGVVGASDLPEVIAVPLVLYEQPGEQETYQILLNVEIAALEQRIYLAPQPLAIANAILAHQQTIRQRLVCELGESARIYFGRL